MAARHQLADREIPMVRTDWTAADHRGAFAVRWGVDRYNYLVEPGLYAIGRPTDKSPVLVTANYKLTFDLLRRELAGQDVFVLVLQTMGINVWCAAGKGSFGTDELCRQIEQVGLKQHVSHGRVVLPQLGAPGVAAHEVRQRTDFRVVYGPVEARDIPLFLESGRKATAAMRRKRFPLHERAALVPMELVPSLKYGVPLALILALLSGVMGPGGFVSNLLHHGSVAALAVLLGVVCGAVLTPLLLPWIPGRAFATKGALVTLLLGVPLLVGASLLITQTTVRPWTDVAGLATGGLALASFLAMNFTGSSTYTGLSGVEREMRFAVPAQLTLGVVGLAGWALSLSLLH